MRAGISSFTYTWAIGIIGRVPDHTMTAFELIQSASRLGADCVQIADNLPLHLFSKSELNSLKSLSDKLDIPVEVGTRGIHPDNINKYLDIASMFNSPILRVVISSMGFDPSLDEVQGIIKDFIPELERRKIILAIENYERFAVHDFVNVMDKAGSEYVGICLDTVNSMGSGEGLNEVINQLAPFTVNLHIKEFIIRRAGHQMGFIIEGAPLGQGMLPLQKIFKKIPARCQSAILEQWVPPDETLNKTIDKEARWAEESIQYLKTSLKG